MKGTKMHIGLGLIIAASLITSPLVFASDKDPQLDKQVETYWAAQAKRDWKTVYDLLSPKQKASTTLAQYSDLRNKSGIFDSLNAKVKDMEIVDDLAWVDIAFDAKIARYPTAPLRHVQNWQLWQKTDNWYLADDQKQNHPTLPPKYRSADEETALAKRAQTAWDNKATQDWKSYYNLLSPDYKALVPLDAFLKKKSQYLYSATHIDWTEVITAKKDQGLVKITFSIKPNDVAASKLEPQQQTMTENWIKQNGEWYFAIPLPSDAAPTSKAAPTKASGVKK